jgi:serine/threonine-protein kinase
MLAGRWRIVGMLGRGGMGEVYRADDLTLGQPVALKFLPQGLEHNEDRLARFFNEVRLSREVSHANVCRVYDVGEVDGQRFLSMEYVDGEDLSSLIRRIGRPSPEKAIEIARQTCAGIAAAHAKGILHRDLKPSNIMIDGEGRVRITDFGLAAVAAAVNGTEIRAGTPDYMAPEQLEGIEVTQRSDVYALGLVLYELFTGKRAFQASSLAELRELRSSTVPRSPSSVTPDIDPVVERVIERCLERNPGARPGSVLAVAAALPGGDPLAAALAAGEVPSPELVAAARAEGVPGPAVAVACFVAVLAGLVAFLGLADRIFVTGSVRFDKPPAALAVEAREMLGRLGYADRSDDKLQGFAFDEGDQYRRFVERADRSPERWKSLGTIRPSPLTYWYRQSPDPILPVSWARVANASNPPWVESGMAGVWLDADGRLLELRAVPPQHDETKPVGPPDWNVLFELAALDPARFEPVEPEWNPLVATDTRAAWTGTIEGQEQVPLRVEAGAWRGKPNYFAIVAPWTKARRMPGQEQESGYWFVVATVIILCGVVIASIVMVRRNLAAGRTDRRGALRMGLFAILTTLVAWSLRSHHVASIKEIGLLSEGVKIGLLVAGIVWLVYLALEPYVRRFWPQVLISWSRILNGRAKDPLVGRDLLYGAVAGTVGLLLISVMRLLPQWVGRAAFMPGFGVFGFAFDWPQSFANLASLLWNSLFNPFLLLLVLLLLRLLLRRQWVAVSVMVLAATSLAVLQEPDVPLIWPIVAVYHTLLLLVLVRLGVFASIVSVFVTQLTLSSPVTLDSSAWFARQGWAMLLVPAILAGYGCYLTMADRNLSRDLL